MKAKIAKSEIILISALGENDRVIGNGLKLPWHIPEDLKRFKALTKGYPLIMGRLTYESLILQFGKQLPGRPHFVLSSRPEKLRDTQAVVFTSMESALKAAETYPKVFIAGGAKIYEQGLELADRWELTIVEGQHEGDVYFPEYDHLVGKTHKMTGCENRYGFRFETFVKIAESPET